MLGVRIQADFMATGDWPVGAALALLDAGWRSCCSTRSSALGAAAARVSTHPVRDMRRPRQRSPVAGLIVTRSRWCSSTCRSSSSCSSRSTRPAALSFPFAGLLAALVPRVFASDEFRSARSADSAPSSPSPRALVTLVLGTAAAVRADRSAPVAAARAARAPVLPPAHAARPLHRHRAARRSSRRLEHRAVADDRRRSPTSSTSSRTSC